MNTATEWLHSRKGSTNVGAGSLWPLPSSVSHGGLVYKILIRKLYANNIWSRVFLFFYFLFNFVNAPLERVFREFMADNEKAYHEIAANTTCEFLNKELLQELAKTRNASMLEDEAKVVHNLKSYLASFKRNNVH